ncbi:hypothetical protein ACA910_021407 [Epithemia clementina (nom. ined.)]
MADANKVYDLVLFGVTGFTGKLAVEYLLEKSYDIRWAACGRNQAKTQAVIQEIVDRVNETKSEKCSVPPIVTADLVVTSPEQEETLATIVQQTKVVLTMAGPFEKYGQTLVKLCAEYGVHYADITGETEFVRQNIEQHDAKARQTGASIVSHCGNDCVPQDLMVHELYQYVQKLPQGKNAFLMEVQTFPEFPATASLSGGTTSTILHHFSKKGGDKKSKKSSSASSNTNNNEEEEAFDSLLRSPDGTKSSHEVKNITTKETIYEKHIGKNVGPWIMGPVMVNCIRRSNALLKYRYDLRYGDAQVKNAGLAAWWNNVSMGARIAGAVALPSLFSGLVPQPGEGPDRDVMENSYMTLHAVAKIRTGGKQGEEEKESLVLGKFHFGKDIGYLYTAYILVEVGMVLLDKHAKGTTVGGVITPAVAMGHELTERLLQTLDATLTIEPLVEEEGKTD